MYEVLRIGKFLETESRLEVTRNWEEREMGLIIEWYRMSVWNLENVLEIDKGEFASLNPTSWI